MNAYQSGNQKVIPAVLLYAFLDDRVLMIEKADHWNGLGGKLELGESPLEAAVREFDEESGLSSRPEQWRWLGHLYFPNFRPQKQEDWSVTVWTIELQESAPLQNPPEGKLHWVPLREVSQLTLWDGDTQFIPHVLSRTPFQGTLFYQDGRCVRSELSTIL